VQQPSSRYLDRIFPSLTKATYGEVKASRELRPRGGRSAWRALYRRVGDVFVVATVGPEAQANPQGFGRMIKLATQRLEELTYEGE
jgi:hypothetical protein